MKTLPEKVRLVRSLLNNLDKEIAGLQKRSGLFCPAGCGKCCEKPAIMVTPLEFLPFALFMYDEGRHEELLTQCAASSTGICVIFRPSITQFGGLCSAYPDRGLMCRLFGYAARRDRLGNAELVTCAIVKQEQSSTFHGFQNLLISGDYKPPFFADYYSRLRNIDPDLCEMLPINQAISAALHYIMHYYSYRRRRRPQGR